MSTYLPNPNLSQKVYQYSRSHINSYSYCSPAPRVPRSLTQSMHRSVSQQLSISDNVPSRKKLQVNAPRTPLPLSTDLIRRDDSEESRSLCFLHCLSLFPQ